MEKGKTLGQFIKEMRTEAQLSLRELAAKIGVSAPFLSDVELGRRNPSPEKLEELAKVFKIPASDFQPYDARELADDLRRLAARDPAFGFAFRTALDDAASGAISPEELLRRIKKTK